MLSRVMNINRRIYTHRLARLFSFKPDDGSGRKITEKILQDAKDFANSKATREILNKITLQLSKIDLEATKIKARKYLEDAKSENKYNIKDIADSKYFKLVSSIDYHRLKLDLDSATLKAKNFFIWEQSEANTNLIESDIRSFSTSGTKSTGSPPPSNEGKSHRLLRAPPGKVELGFIPTEWVQAFHPKTGVSGFYTLLFTLGISLASKEILVMEHEYYSGLTTILFWWLAAKYVGPGLAQSIDKEVDAYEKDWNEGRVSHKQVLEESIVDENHLQASADGQLLLLEAKRENVHLQLEDEFRKRQMKVYKDVKNRLEYQITLNYIYRRNQHVNIIEWTRKKVVDSITPEFDKLHLDECFQELQNIANREAAKK